MSNVVLFGTLGLLWTTNILLMLFWRRLNANTMTAIVLYTIIGLIIIFRITEVMEITVYDPNVLTTVSGTVATYAKIALGCCQIFAMFEIRNQMKEQVRTYQIGSASEIDDSFDET